MLTPAFELTQNEKFLIASIQVPFAKISDVQIEFDQYDFMFYSKPYFLRLNLPGKVVYTEEPSIKYDFDKRTFIIQVPKSQEGEIFENLDLLTKLLVPKKEKIKGAPLIEIIDGTDDTESDEEYDWAMEQSIPTDDFGNLNISGQQCGFGNTYSFSVFNLKEESEEIFDMKDPQNKTVAMRKEERTEKEAEDFDEDHYIADLYEDDEIQNILQYKPEWEILYEQLQNDSSICSDEKVSFSPEEKDRLLKLPNKEYILDKTQRLKVFYGLIDILFAYAYNKRTTEGENNVESSWTINKLSATLSWLDTFTSINEVARSCIRRSLCYPLYRHFELSVTILEDVRKILYLGKKYVIKCMLEVHQMFNLSEPRYILNDLFITDYCVWLQTKKCSSKKFEPMAINLGKVLLTKGDIGLNLVDVESFAAVAWMSEAKPDCESALKKCAVSKSPCQDSNPDLEALNSHLQNLAIAPNYESDGNSTDTSSRIYLFSSSDSEYEVCSSCTSHSSSSSCSSWNSSFCSSSESSSDESV